MKAEKNLVAKVRYDLETDIFIAVPMRRKYSSSFQEQNIILDLDDDRNIVGLEVLSAQESFGVSSDFFLALVSVDLELRLKDSGLFIDVLLTTAATSGYDDVRKSFHISHSSIASFSSSSVHMAIA